MTQMQFALTGLINLHNINLEYWTINLGAKGVEATTMQYNDVS